MSIKRGSTTYRGLQQGRREVPARIGGSSKGDARFQHVSGAPARATRGSSTYRGPHPGRREVPARIGDPTQGDASVPTLLHTAPAPTRDGIVAPEMWWNHNEHKARFHDVSGAPARATRGSSTYRGHQQGRREVPARIGDPTKGDARFQHVSGTPPR